MESFWIFLILALVVLFPFLISPLARRGCQPTGGETAPLLGTSSLEESADKDEHGTATPSISREEMQDINATAQMGLEAIYTDLDTIGRLQQEFSGTYSLQNAFNPFKNAAGWTLNAQRRFQEAEVSLGLHFLVLVMHSKHLVAILTEGYSHKNEQVFQVLLGVINENMDSIFMFALARGSNWFDQYKLGSRPAFMTSLIDPMVANTRPPSANHPHELYQRFNGQIQRNVFQDLFNKSHCMVNTKENIFHPPHWIQPGPRPEDWHQALPWPGNPSLCHQCINGRYPICRGCNNSLGILSSCDCRNDSERVYIAPLVEIRQYAVKMGFKRGVRALSPIVKDQLLGEFTGELIPLGQQGLSPFGDTKYTMTWMPQPRLNAGGLTALIQPVVGAIATLICGRNGNWTKFIAGSGREANVAAKQMAFSGSWRIAVYALRDIEFGEQIMIDYRRAAVDRRPRRKRGVVYMFQKALSNVDEEDEYQDSDFG